MEPQEEGFSDLNISPLERNIAWEDLENNSCIEPECKIHTFFSALLEPSDFDNDDGTEIDDFEAIADE